MHISAIRASGPGGQHVNKTASAIHLQLDIEDLDLSEADRARIYDHNDSRISESGVITIKAQNGRSQSRNKRDAIDRLTQLLRDALRIRKKRRKTRPSRGAINRARKRQQIHKEKKAFRAKIQPPE